MIFLTIIVAIFVAAAEIDICVSSFPVINDEFALSAFQTEFLLSFNLIAHALSALFMGNLGDKYGKKRFILFGLGIFVIGSVISAISQSFILVLLGRVLQGAGAAAPMVLAPLIVLDVYQGLAQQKRMNILNGVCTLGVSFAPIVGSYTTLFFGWRANFVLLIVAGGLAWLLCAVFLPHDKCNRREVSLSIREYAIFFRSQLACLYLLALCFVIGAYYVFVGMGSLIYVDSLGVSLKYFGLYQGLMAFVFGIACLVAPAIVERIGNQKAFVGSFALLFIFLVLCFLAIVFNIKDPNILTGIMIISSVGYVIPLNLVYVLGLSVIPDKGGKMSALVQVGKWLCTVVGVQTASYFYSHDFRSTGIMTLTMDCIGTLLILLLIKQDSRLRKEIGLSSGSPKASAVVGS